MTTTTTPATITVTLANGKYFGKALKYAKQFGGRFNPATKTWDIPIKNIGDADPRTYGLYPVSPTAAAATRHDASCPALMGGACECDAQTR